MPRPALRMDSESERLWRLITERLQELLPRQSYLTWFKPVNLVEIDDSRINLCVPSRFYYDWIEGHYSKVLHDAIREVIGREMKLEFTVEPNGRSGAAVESYYTSTESETPPMKANAGFDSHLNPRLTFENFIEGDCNKFARAAAYALANAPGKTKYNPLMVFGGSGLGKTHLVQAIGNYIMNRGLAKRVLYVTSEQFTADFVQALKSSHVDDFNRLYRSVDVLLLDDVHFFMAKDKTQEQFFHTFNALHHAGKQLVFSSDRPPRELEGFDERLVNRLQWGLISEIRAPEYETRLAILTKLAEIDNTQLNDDVAHFLAVNITDNVRTLQGALTHILAQSSLMKREISLQLVKSALRQFANRPTRQISVERIQEIVSRAFNLHSDQLRSKSRKKDIVEARQVAMYLCTEYSNMTLKAIGLHFGGRDHATVIHARDTVADRVKSEPNSANQIEDLKRQIELASL